MRSPGRGAGAFDSDSAAAAAHCGWECVTSHVAIESETPAGWRPHLPRGVPEDDGGLSFLTLAGRAEQASTAATCWCSYWLVPDGTDRSARFRFVVETLEGDVLHSEAFDLETGDLPRCRRLRRGGRRLSGHARADPEGARCICDPAGLA